MSYNFKNKKILITGSTSGLGLVCAKNFIAKKATVYVCGRKKKNLALLKNDKLNNIYSFCGDLLVKKNFLRFIKGVKQKMKKIDIIIHCLGGGLGLKNPLLNGKEFLKLHQTNIGIAAEINRLLKNQLSKDKSFILHIGSIASVEAIGSVGYNTVKTSLVAYVKSLAINLIKDNVIVTGLLPGAFEAKDNAFERLKKRNYKVYKNFIKKRIPGKKIRNAEEFLPLINLLCSSEGEILAGSSISADACESRAYNLN